MPYTRVIYLSPLLELRGWDCLVLVAAHELAHVVLNHAPFSYEEQSNKSEREVYRQVCAWGFAREARKMEKVRKAIDAEEAPPAENLAPLVPLVWKAGIETLQYNEDERPGTACIEFAGSGDAEMFLNISQREYKVEVEQWDEGMDGRSSFRVRLLVFFSIGDIPGLVTTFNEHNRCARIDQGPASE